MSGETKIVIPGVPKPSDSAYVKARKHELFRKRAGIEPVIGHCKDDHHLGRNFYKGLFGDTINVMLAAAAFNFKRVLRILLRLICWWIQWSKSAFGGGIAVSQNLACAYVRTFYKVD